MFDKKLKNILAVLLLVLFVVSLTASAVSASSTSKSVSLYYLQLAATSDPARPQGGTTPGAVGSVKIVEAALVKAGFLADNSYAKDGSYGTATIKAYKKWQKSLGSAEKYCDGIPGKKDLTKLGNKYGFTVDTSTPSIKLNVPLFRQDDPQWSKEKLGYSTKGSTIGSAGCAITSISMVFKYYGVQTDPKKLNTWLKANNGYSGGDVKWEIAPGISKGKIKYIGRIDYTHVPADLNKIKSEIKNGNPVIAQVKAKSGKDHFVVITGYSGSTYYINDPLKGKSELSYYNKDPAKAIYGIRIYH